MWKSSLTSGLLSTANDIVFHILFLNHFSTTTEVIHG
jgi:hypothetical protein